MINIDESIEKIPSVQIKDQVFDVLYDKIITSAWPIGSKIPSENELCRMLGISRVSVRSAIQKMTSMGLLEVKRGEGTFVTAFSLEEYLKRAVPLILKSLSMKDVLQFREGLETQAIRTIVENKQLDGIEILEKAFVLSNLSFEQKDVSGYVENDFIFHRQLCIMSKNAIILTMWDVFAEPLANSIKENVTEIFQKTDPVGNPHRLLIDALRNLDQLAAVHQLHLIINGIIEFF